MSLANFFQEMSGFLEGTTPAETLEARLGRSRSGTERLALYPELVRRQRAAILAKLFRSTAAAVRDLRPRLWDELVAGFTAKHPPWHWEPNRFGEAFPGHLAFLREGGEELLAYLEELADYEWIRHAVSVAPPPAEGDGVGLDRTLYVRHYGHDVVPVVSGLAAGKPPVRPTPAPTTLVVCWSRRDHRLVVLRASAAVLVVIGRRRGQDPTAGRVVPGLDPATLAAAERELVERGVLERRADERMEPPRDGDPRTA